MLLDFMPLYIRCGMSFSSNYFHHAIGSTYDEQTMKDPILRFEMEKKQEIYIREKYPTFFYIDEASDVENKYQARGRLGIGVATIPKSCGCEVTYRDHMNPLAKPLISRGESPLSLKMPDLDDGLCWLYEEIDKFEETGFKKGSLSLPDLQGPLNVSMKLMGDDRMLALIARKNKEKEVEHVLDIATRVYIEVNKRLRKATNRPLKSNWSVSGCTYYYLSPKKWQIYILPVIERCRSELGDGVRLHHCGKADGNKIKSYAQLKWNDCEFGFGSDLKLARKTFDYPDLGPINISCRVSPFRMLNQPAAQIREDINWIIENAKGGPMRINCVGVPHGTPEENLWAMWDAVQDYNKKKAEEEDEDY